jgi:hypothetical protein
MSSLLLRRRLDCIEKNHFWPVPRGLISVLMHQQQVGV